MRKIYESHVIDYSTGEVMRTSTVKSSSHNETFLFARTSEGLEWINDFKNMQDLKSFMYMVEFQEPKSGVIIFTGLQIKNCALFFNCTEKTIRNSISSLLKTGFLKRLASNNYYANPYTFYKGGSKVLLERIETWKKLELE